MHPEETFGFPAPQGNFPEEPAQEHSRISEFAASFILLEFSSGFAECWPLDSSQMALNAERDKFPSV
jgi:hypothetical protein